VAEDEVEPGAVAEQFFDVSRRIGRGSRRAQLGPLSVARYDVLHTVFHQPDVVMGQLASRLGIAARSATDLVAGLESDGYLRRVPHRGDRRKTALAITDAGMQALREARRDRIAGSAAPFAALTTRERATLATLLAKVAAAAGDQAGAPA
jgi:DNA-binding MarR family transcriptional regulator